MTNEGVRADPALGRASLPGAPVALGATEAPVVLAAPAAALPFLLEGERVALVGSERRGIEAVRIDGLMVAADVHVDAGTAANVVVGPATLRRELIGPRGSTMERALALPALPAVVAQWSSAAIAPSPPVSMLEVTLCPGERAVRYRVDEGGARAAPDDTTVVDAVVHPAPDEWAAAPAEGGGVRLRATVAGPGPVTLMIAAGTPDAVARALAAAPHLGSHEIRAAGSADPAKVHTLAVHTGVPELDDGVTWATARVLASLRRPGAGATTALFWSGVGASAAGDAAAARRAVDAIDPEDPLGVLLAARHALASGEQDPALACFARLTPERVDDLHRAGGDAWRLWRDALLRLADALRNAAPEQELDGLRRAAGRASAEAARGVRLPMAGAPATRPSDGASWPGWLLGAAMVGAARTTEPSIPAPDRLAAWAALSGGDADEGYGAWRRRLADGLKAGPAGRGSWDAVPDPWGPGAPEAGILLATLAHGLLGIDPDEPSGRIGLAPRLPGHVRSFSVTGIRVGDATLSLDYRREDGVHRFDLRPMGGRIPVMAVLEPSVAAASVAETRVDGAAADLERVPDRGRTRVRVQIPLDADRTVEIVEG